MNLFGLVACAAAPVAHPNVLLVVLDHVRADRTSLTASRDTTPNIAKLATHGVVFDRAFAVSTAPSPVYAAALDDLGAQLWRAGYAASAFDGGETPDAALPVSLFDTAPPAAAWIAAHTQKPWFAYVRGGDARPPFAQRGPFRHLYGSEGQSLRTERIVASAPLLASLRGPAPSVVLTAPEIAHIADHYDTALTYGDLWIGVLLADIDLSRTVVIVVGETGEDLLDHPADSDPVADSTLRVPLVVAGPGFPAGVHRADAVSTLDVVATVRAVTGAAGATDAAGAGDPTAPGRSLLLPPAANDIVAVDGAGRRHRRAATGEWAVE